MSLLLNLYSRLYARLLYLFPPRFRNVFGEEMYAVFNLAAADAAARGWREMSAFMGRESSGFLRALITEHWHALQVLLVSTMAPYFQQMQPSLMGAVGRQLMAEGSDAGNFNLRDQRSKAIAALPLLLFGIGLALPVLLRGGPWYTLPAWRLVLSIVIGLIPLAVVGIGGLYGLYKRIPDWSYTWVGTAGMGFVLMIKIIGEELADQGRFIISQRGDDVLAISILLVGFVFLASVSVKGWQRAGLIGIGMAGAFGLSLCTLVASPPFNRYDLALLSAPLGLLLAGMVWDYSQASDSARLGIILSTGVINVGIVLMASSVWYQWLAETGKASPVFPLMFFTTVALLTAPLLGLITPPIRRALHRS
jgi:hypothetical protein